jgi:glutamine synthetase adenylyltransferase
VKPADLFLSSDLTEEQAQAYLQSIGFRDPAAADRALQAMADALPVRLALGEVAEALVDSLRRVADPNAAVDGLARYLATRMSKVTLLNHLRDDPKATDVLLQIFGSRGPLTEMLLRDPEHFHWLTSRIDRRPSMNLDDDELPRARAGQLGPEALERLCRRQFLRVGARAMTARETPETAAAQLSQLADLIATHVADPELRAHLDAELALVRAFVARRPDEIGT